MEQAMIDQRYREEREAALVDERYHAAQQDARLQRALEE